MRKIIFLSFIVLTSSPIFAQRTVFEHFSFTYAGASGASAPSFMYHQSLTFGKNQMFRVGTGFKVNLFWGKNNSLTSPNNYTMTFTGKSQSTSINIPLIFEFHSKHFIAGANVDLLGLTFGIVPNSPKVQNYSGSLDTLSAKVVGVNFLPGRKGTINSELYVGYSPQPEFTIRAGLTFISSQYSTTYYSMASNGYVDFDKFRYQSQALPFVSIVFNIER